MKELFNLLTLRERRILGLLCLLLLSSLLFFIFCATAEKGRYFRSLETFSLEKNALQKIESGRDQKEKEWQEWQKAFQDMNELKNKYFYYEKDGITQLRRDLQKIFVEVGLQVSSIKYDYTDFEAEKMKKVKVSFDVTGSYLSLKKFLYSVEVLPKFLVIERIDFLNNDSQSGGFKLIISLAGYYES